jgi:Zn-dependent M28 family amino/carboxypeptidase
VRARRRQCRLHRDREHHRFAPRTGSGKAVLVSAHYDSVPGGPASATMVRGRRRARARARFSGKQTGNDIVFLISDGEETGLRGAHALPSAIR